MHLQSQMMNNECMHITLFIFLQKKTTTPLK
jgi:hypothetical protein